MTHYGIVFTSVSCVGAGIAGAILFAKHRLKKQERNEVVSETFKDAATLANQAWEDRAQRHPWTEPEPGKVVVRRYTTRRTPYVKWLICNKIRQGSTIREALEYANIGKTTFGRWRKLDHEFDQSVNNAMQYRKENKQVQAISRNRMVGR